jgi:hypothetical protein
MHKHEWKVVKKGAKPEIFICKCGVRGKRVDYGNKFYIEEIHYEN